MACKPIFTYAIVSFFLSAFAAQGATAPTKDVSVEEFMQNLSSIPNVVSRKDPFVKAKMPFEKMVKQTDSSEIVATAPILERYPVGDYYIAAIMVGDSYPRALVKTPDKKVYIVRENDKLGNHGGVIKKISSGTVTVLQKLRSSSGFVEESNIVLNVGTGGNHKEEGH